MPELPEVETIARGLAGLGGQRIASIDVLWPSIVQQPSADDFATLAMGRVIKSVSRRAKFLIFGLDHGSMIVHLRMTGQLLWRDAVSCIPADKHVHLSLYLESGRAVDYRDVRKFGRFWLVEDETSVLGHLGPEPFDTSLTADRFFGMLTRRRRMLKALLLDQRFIAGLGNIYVDESLYRAGLAPQRLSSSLSVIESARLLGAIRDVLSTAILAHGTTLQDYREPDGQRGENQHRLFVYGQQGTSCPRCGAEIAKHVVAGRGTHFCPVCQPMPSA